MSSTLEQLSLKEKQALALLYGTEGYKALQKVHQLEVAGLGKDAIMAPTMEAVHFVRGRAHQSKLLLSLIKDCSKQAEKS